MNTIFKSSLGDVFVITIGGKDYYKLRELAKVIKQPYMMRQTDFLKEVDKGNFKMFKFGKEDLDTRVSNGYKGLNRTSWFVDRESLFNILKFVNTKLSKKMEIEIREWIDNKGITLATEREVEEDDELNRLFNMYEKSKEYDSIKEQLEQARQRIEENINTSMFNKTMVDSSVTISIREFIQGLSEEYNITEDKFMNRLYEKEYIDSEGNPTERALENELLTLNKIAVHNKFGIEFIGTGETKLTFRGARVFFEKIISNTF